MTSFICLPYKKGYEVDLVKSLENVIIGYFGSCDHKIDLNEPLHKLVEMRNACISKSLETNDENALLIYQKYYDNLTSLENKCSACDFRIPFKWRDAFDKSSSFLSTSTLTMRSLFYEKLCLLFNMASICSQVAAQLGAESVLAEERLRKMAKYFQMSAGYIDTIKHIILNNNLQVNTYDFDKELLDALLAIMMAQAQESFYHKAAKDKKSSAILARICHQTYEYYNQAVKHIYSIRISVERSWSPLLTVKSACFEGLSEYYQSLVCDEKKRFGEQIARLERTLQLLNEDNLKTNQFDVAVREIIGRARIQLIEIKKDNDFIYHEQVPDLKSLESIGNAPLAKATKVPNKFLPEGEDIFAHLLPLPVQQAVHKLDVRKQDLINTEVGSLKDQMNMTEGVLASLNLPASLEDIVGDQELPPSLAQKIKVFKTKGGLKFLKDNLRILPERSAFIMEILTTTQKDLDNEDKLDREVKDKYNYDKFVTSSTKTNENWRYFVDKYLELMKNAITADKKLADLFAKHEQKFILFENSENELKLNIPVANRNSGNFAESGPADQLRDMLNELDQLKKKQEDLIEQFKNKSFDDMKNKFMSALSENGQINEAALSAEALGEAYAPLQKEARELKKQQLDLIESVKKVNEEFVKLKFGSTKEDKREIFLTEVSAALEAFAQLCSNINDGTDFYSKVADMVLNVQQKVSDFCLARNAEREELLKDLDVDASKDSNKEHLSVKEFSYKCSINPSADASNSSAPPPANYENEPVAPASGQPSAYPQMPYGAPYSNPYNQFYYPPPPLPPTYPTVFPTFFMPGQYPTAQYPGYAPQTMQDQQPNQPQPYPGYTHPPYPQQPPF